MKKILGLDLGTNSIGWAVTSQEKEGTNKYTVRSIDDVGCRIMPMDAGAMSDFESGVLKSQTAERTFLRGVRRLNERHLLRRERLHRVLNIMGFLPKHYSQDIDFEVRLGQFKPNCEPKLSYARKEKTGKHEFLFMNSFNEMLKDFATKQPLLTKVSHDWTIYFLRKKALSQKIEKEELAWILLHCNQKRGYYQARGEEEEDINVLKEYDILTVQKVIDTGDVTRGDTWYEVHLSDGGIYKRSSKTPLDWVGKEKEFIITYKVNKAGEETRSYSMPKEGDWTLVKKRTEDKLKKSEKTVGEYIYNTLLSKPHSKIIGGLIQTIERDNYKLELKQILEKQKEFHPELNDKTLYTKCVAELYRSNLQYRESIADKDFTYLLANDILFYHRPLKSKKSLIDDCQYEKRRFRNPKTNEWQTIGVKCIHRSHPLFEEFRLWQLVQNLKILDHLDKDVSEQYFGSEEQKVELFDKLRDLKQLDQKSFLGIWKLGKTKLRWNYGDATLPLCPVRYDILRRLGKVDPSLTFSETEMVSLWHILYSVTDVKELKSALAKFAIKQDIQLVDAFVAEFSQIKPFESQYGAYSEKAIKKLLPLIRLGKYWNENDIDSFTKKRIDKIIDGVDDEKISDRTRDNLANLRDITQFRGLRLHQACYSVYNRHSEASSSQRWESPKDIDDYLANFKQHSLRNPIVEQVITETLRTVRDIWQKHGTIDEIHVELGREMKLPKDKRAELASKNAENERTNVRIRELLREIRNSDSTVRPESPSDQQRLKLYEEGVVGATAELPDYIVKIRGQREPSKADVLRYKIWLEQGYKSPYTGRMIPLSELFSNKYQVDHIIPQSRYFDDSLSNKVICESEINLKKGNSLAYEFIKENINKKFDITGLEVTLLSPEDYEEAVKQNFKASRNKLKKLLMEDIPASFIDRQLNDTRYISKVIRNILSNIVRGKNEIDAVSSNVITVNGAITSRLKADWGINDVWNNIVKDRFIRLNKMENSNDYGEWIDNKFVVRVPDKYSRGFSKKRLDHRHHAMDAIVIACATRSHINYLGNESAKEKDCLGRIDLRTLLCGDKRINGRWILDKPYKNFTQEVENMLRNIVVSIKKNTRIITKSNNSYQKIVDGKKVMVKQTKGDNRAIRKPLHKDTVFGLVDLQLKKTVSLSVALDAWEQIVNKSFRSKIKSLIAEKFDKKAILSHFKAVNNRFEGEDISRVEIFYYSSQTKKDADVMVAVRKPLDATFDAKKINAITDTGIQKILHQHLLYYNGKHEEAFSPDGLDVLNDPLMLKELNDGKAHMPIRNVRVSEVRGNKFRVGELGNKGAKFVEAAKGTNLFFALYESAEGKRSYETVALEVAIANLKMGESMATSTNKDGDKLLFILSPNDFVYLPTAEQIERGNVDVADVRENKDRVYKFVSCTGNEGHFIPVNIAAPIVPTIELGANNKAQRAWTDEMIKEICIKLKVDRLGRVEVV